MLWLQEMQARRLLPLSKVWGEENPADLMTKNVPIEKVLKCIIMMSMFYETGRADKAAKLHMVTTENVEGDRWIGQGEDRVWRRQHSS